MKDLVLALEEFLPWGKQQDGQPKGGNKGR